MRLKTILVIIILLAFICLFLYSPLGIELSKKLLLNLLDKIK